MEISSPAFEHHETIPTRYTCEGEDVSPPLNISDVPEGTVSFAIIVDDPDAPMGTFDHWIAWNISGTLSEFEEGMSVALQGTNGFGEDNYRGPCPPPGPTHRYFFKVYALDSELDLPSGSSKMEVEAEMEGHILDQAELMGIFGRE